MKEICRKNRRFWLFSRNFQHNFYFVMKSLCHFAFRLAKEAKITLDKQVINFFVENFAKISKKSAFLSTLKLKLPLELSYILPKIRK